LLAGVFFVGTDLLLDCADAGANAPVRASARGRYRNAHANARSRGVEDDDGA